MQDHQQEVNQEILTACQHGDKKSMNVLFETYASRMYKVCLRYSPDQETAKDFLHDGFIKIFKVINQFKGQSKLSSWMTRVFINECINKLKKRKADIFYVGEYNHDIMPDETEEYREHDYPIDKVMKAIQRLPDKYKVVINMYAVDNLKHKEISKLLNITVGSSKSRLSRARVLLIKELKNSEES